MRRQSSSTNFTGVTQRLSHPDSSQFLSPTTQLPQLSQLRAPNWRGLVHKQTSDCDFKIHPRIYPGTTCCLPAVPHLLQIHVLHNPEPLLTTRNNFLPPEWQWSVQFSIYCRGDIWLHSGVFTSPSHPLMLQNLFITHQSFWKNIQ